MRRVELVAGSVTALLLSAVLVSSPVWSQASGEVELPEGPIDVSGAVPVSPQPTDDQVVPGLSVQYAYQKFYTLSQVRQPDEPFVTGDPILILDHDTETGNVLTAEYPLMVGALINGMIRFPETGTYILKVNSNDGVWVSIGEQEIWHDPEVHYHRMSPEIYFEVAEPGWYELAIDYFQKKGSSALQLFWTPPGGTESIVPAEAFGHVPQTS